MSIYQFVKPPRRPQKCQVFLLLHEAPKINKLEDQKTMSISALKHSHGFFVCCILNPAIWAWKTKRNKNMHNCWLHCNDGCFLTISFKNSSPRETQTYIIALMDFSHPSHIGCSQSMASCRQGSSHPRKAINPWWSHEKILPINFVRLLVP